LRRAVSFQPITGKHKADTGFFLSIHIPGAQVKLLGLKAMPVHGNRFFLAPQQTAFTFAAEQV
jgi:hypothetical protein